VYVVGVGTKSGSIIPDPAILKERRADSSRSRSRRYSRSHGRAAARTELDREPDRDIAAKSSPASNATLAEPAGGKLRRTLLAVLFAAGVLLCLGTVLLSGPAELWLQAAAVLVAALILTSY
jgi:hypothetical protein